LKVLITGASGFIGLELCERMLNDGWQITGTVRSEAQALKLPFGVEPLLLKSIDVETNWLDSLRGIDIIIHLAARVHVMRELSSDPLKEFRKVNTEGTVRLAREAVAAGVKKFIFMSTIGVNGNSSGEIAYTENDTPVPHNLYSISKMEAEEQLLKLFTLTKVELVIIRAPLVYGEKNPGNFLTLLNIVSKGFPLPFASIQNTKSFIYIGNLIDVLNLCANHREAKGLYLVSDGEDISTPELLRKVAVGLQIPIRLFPCPYWLIRLTGKLLGKYDTVERLLSSLTINNSKIHHELGWIPPFTMQEGLENVAKWYKLRKKNCRSNF
jgi:nucleoside-diphosphate-sugar epimerase